MGVGVITVINDTFYFPWKILLIYYIDLEFVTAFFFWDSSPVPSNIHSIKWARWWGGESRQIDLVNKLKRRGERLVVRRTTGRYYNSWWPEGTWVRTKWVATEMGEKGEDTIDTEKDKILQDLLTDRIRPRGTLRYLFLVTE